MSANGLRRLASYKLAKTKSTSKQLRKGRKLQKLVRIIIRINDGLYAISRNFEVHPDFNSNIEITISEFGKMIRTRGPRGSVKGMKDSRLAVSRFYSGVPLESAEYVSLRNGIPSGIPEGKISKTPSGSEVRMGFTLLSISRVLTLPPELDVDSITNPSKQNHGEIHSLDITKALRELKVRKYSGVGRGYHLTTKSGPNGQALATCLQDLTALPKPLYEALCQIGREAFIRVTLLLKDEVFLNFGNTVGPSPKPSKQLIRKLAYFPDKEGKTRVIAIFDYGSQSILKPLHDHLNGCLRRISTDCTFNQDHFQSCLPPKGPYYSLDLKSATDRMPVDLQERIISRIVGPEHASLGRSILVDYPLVSGTNSYKYSVGQPMGAYSSGPAMALTHHVIVRIAAYKVGYNSFKDYALLGDDIVIADRKVAESYQELLKVLDMPISMQKTHVSEDMYEFAKRWVMKNEEVTGFSISGLLETGKSYPLFDNFIETQLRHGGKIKEDKDPGLFLKDIMSSFGKREQSPRTQKVYNIYRLFRSYILKNEAGVPQKIGETLALPFEQDEIPVLNVLLNKAISIVFKAQAARDDFTLQTGYADYLIHITEKLVNWISETKIGAEEAKELRTALVKAHPISQLFEYRLRSIMEQLDDVKDFDQYYLDVFNSQELRSKFGTLEVFSMRTVHSKIYSQAKIVKDLGGKLNEFYEKPNPNKRERTTFSKITEKSDYLDILLDKLELLTKVEAD